MPTVTVMEGDSRELLRKLPDASVDAVATDPPYALVSIGKRFGKPGSAPAAAHEGAAGAYARASAGFMGQQWDTGETAFAVEFWAEVLRVLKPGGHVVAFGGTRTYHRLACAIEDAGFEIRDMVAWLYGSGFPKSHNVGKGIAKRRTEDLEPMRVICRAIRAAMDAARLKSSDLAIAFDCNPRLIDHWAARDTDSQPSLPTPAQWYQLAQMLPAIRAFDREFARLTLRKGTHGERWAGADVIGQNPNESMGFGDQRFTGDRTIRELDDEAAAWQGWGTALKPALEPVCLARKPLQGTVAANALAHGTGALNIDGCRVGMREARELNRSASIGYGGSEPQGIVTEGGQGRWPANVVHDGSDDAEGAFPGEAARFFYSAKADADDRLQSKHPTVKPTDLMAWLIRLITPPGGTVLDPFAGSGSTGMAAMREGFNAILMEREAQFCADIRRRVAHVHGHDLPLFSAEPAE